MKMEIQDVIDQRTERLRGSYRSGDNHINYPKKIQYMKIADMKLNGMTLQEIANKRGTSREAVRQILKKYFFDLEFPNLTGYKRKRRKPIKIKCLTCKKVSVLPDFKMNRSKNFCNRYCWTMRDGGKWVKNVREMNKEDYNKYNRERANVWYHKHKNDSGAKEKRKEMNRRAHVKRMKLLKNGK